MEEIRENAKKLILRNTLSPGDIVILTAAVRDLHKSNPGRFLTDVRTSCPQIWDNNPYLTSISDVDVAAQTIDCQYPLIHKSNETPFHFIHGFMHFLSETLNVDIWPSEFKGDIHLSIAEKEEKSQVETITGTNLPFWVLVSGGKNDFTIKWWSSQRYQEVVDHFEGKIQFALVGEKNHNHPPLHGVLDLRGKTDLRQLIKLVYHSQGVLCGVTLLMHLAAAVELRDKRIKNRPCVVVAGGREPVHWEAYPHHQFIHTIGSLSCCSHGGCWKSRTKALGDGDEKDHKENLCSNVRGDLPRCMDLIDSDEVIRRIELSYKGGLLRYLTVAQAALGTTFSTPRLGDSKRGADILDQNEQISRSISKLRVLHVLPYGDLWGTERTVINLCRATKANTVGVVLGKTGVVAQELSNWGINWFDLSLVDIAPSEGNRLQKAVDGADLIHIHCCEYIPKIFEFAKGTNLPIVITLQWPSVIPEMRASFVYASQELSEMQPDMNRGSIILNGIDLEMFKYRAKPSKSKTILIRICRPKKCADYFLPAMKKVLAQNPQAELWIVGEGGESTNQIKYLGIRSDIPELLAQADIFVNVPRPNEGAHDLAILEAMAMGVPAVVSNVACVRGSITNRDDGILVPYGDEELFIGGVNRLISDCELRVGLASNAVEKARTQFDIRKTATRYLEVYQRAFVGWQQAAKVQEANITQV